MIAYNLGNTTAQLYDEPIYAWLIDDVAKTVTPVMPGSWPTPPTNPSASPPYVMVDVAADRVTLPASLTPLSIMTFFHDIQYGPQGHRRLQAHFLAPVLQNAFANWALANPDGVV
jgi:hypothetical protein